MVHNDESMAANRVLNPFEITKAVDFTDEKLDQMWVDWPAPGGFAELINIRSPMPRIVLGGKGTGRTHLMRRFSAPVQVIRGVESQIAQVLKDGVLGVYVRCSGLNSSRFGGRGQDEEVWQSVFSHYVDLWLSQAALDAFATVTSENLLPLDVERDISEEVRRLILGGDEERRTSLMELKRDLQSMQRRIDIAVNNAPFRRGHDLDVEIRSTRGALVFGIPNALKKFHEPLRDIGFLYLVDEFENFDAPQQQYINSLIREKEHGTSFMVGVRTYGLKTLSTLGGKENNRVGSEYEAIRPDQNYIGTARDKFGDFCRRVIASRLADVGLMDDTNPDTLRERLAQFFEVPDTGYEEETGDSTIPGT